MFKTIIHYFRIFLFLCILTGWTHPIPALAQTNDKELFLVAQKAFDDGFYDVAIRYIEQLLHDYPQTEKRAQANLILGQCYYFQNQYLKAYEVFQRNLQFVAFKDATLFWLGETYLKGADYKQAEAHFNQLLDLYPQSEYIPQAYYSLGWLFFETEQFDKAKKFFTTLHNKFPDHQLAEDATFKLGETEYQLKNYEKAIELLNYYLTQYPKSTRLAETYFYLAEANYYLNDYLTAVSWYAKTADASFDPNLILMSKVSMGWSYIKLEKFTLAQQSFEDALKFSQEKGILSDDIYLGLATLYTQNEEYDKALEAYKNLNTLFPTSQRAAESYLGQANVYYQLKNYTQAITIYQELIEKFVNDPKQTEVIEKAYFGLAWSYLKSKNVDMAVKTFYAIKDKTKNETVKISALTQMGDAYQDLDEFDKAIDIYDEILENYPESPYTDYVQYRQGVALLKLGQVDAATMSFQTLERNFPESKYSKDKDYYLAVAYFKKGDWTMAKHKILDFMENPTKESDFIAEANYMLGLSYQNLDDQQNAIDVFNKIIREFPQNQTIFQNAELNIAKSYYRLDNITEAIKRFRALLTKYPQSPIAEEALIWLGDHYAKTQDFNNAIIYYKQCIDEFPGGEQVDIIRFQLAQAYEAKADFNSAIATYKQIDPKNSIIHAKAMLAIGNIFSGKLDTTQAIETYQKIMTTSPEFKRDALLKIADVYRNQQQFNQAIEIYQDALNSDKGQSDVTNAQLHFLVADTYEVSSQFEKALDEYFKVGYLFPNEMTWVTKSYLRIARIYEDQQHWEEAKTTYKKIIDLKRDESVFAQERLDWINNNNK